MAQNKLKYAPTTNAFQTSLNGAINATATTITLNSVTGLQNKAGILVIDRVNSAGTATPSQREYIYFTGVSGSSVTLPSVADGRGQGGSTGQSHADGAIVEAVVDVDAWNGLVDSYAAQHADAGTHTSLTTDRFSAGSTVSLSASLFTNTLNVASTASVGGELNAGRFRGASGASIYQASIINRLLVPVGVSGASLSGEVSVDTTQNNLLVGTGTIGAKLGIGAWASWTPSYTFLTVGNGTVVAKYIQVGKIVVFYYQLTFGSTTTIDASNPTISLPTSASSNLLDDTPIGHLNCFDNGTGYYYGQVWKRSAVMFPIVGDASGTYVKAVGPSSTIPFTWTTGDVLVISGAYEAA